MSVIVKSSVKEIVKAKNLRCGAEVFEAFDKWAEARIKKAIERAIANGRKTIRPEDL
jgi:histone H3/H4